MKRIRLLRHIMRQTGADKIWTGFVIFFLACALVIWLREPVIASYRDALWYCYAVVTTVGFGDVTVTSFTARMLSVLLSIYAVLVIAIVTGVVVNYYNHLVAVRQNEALNDLMDQLERLPELSQDELRQIARQVRNHRESRRVQEFLKEIRGDIQEKTDQREL